MAIDAEVNVATAGDYYIVGFLKSDNTSITSRSSNEATILLSYALPVSEPGITTTILTFSGEDIYHSGIDGIYTTDLAILDENGFVIDYQPFDTIAYNHAQFGELPARMGISTDYGEDTDGDGLLEYLTVEVDIKVMRAMNYSLEGLLYSHEGQFITSLVDTRYSANSTVIELNFDGTKISKAEKNGPYLLAITLNDENNSQIDYQEYETSSYGYPAFHGPEQRFTDNYSDYGTDADNDGLFNYLTIEVGVEAATSGNYTIEGWLYDSNDKPIEIATTSAYLNVGVQSVVLSFNGLSVYRNQVDGPYYLKYLIISGSTPIDFIEDAYTTYAYKSTDFQKPPIPLVALTGNYWDYGTDINSDGILDYLTVDVEVMLANPGYVVIKARLMDINEEEIVWAENIANLVANQPQIIQLNFDGEAIYNHRVDGPYYLRDVYIYHTGDPTQPDYMYDAYTTGYYNCNKFGENNPPVADAGPDQTVEQSSYEGANITLDGSGSSDPDGDPLTYTWTWNSNSATGVNPTIALPPGTTTVSLLVNDGTVDSEPDEVDITVQDTTPPEISVTVSPDMLWPPNHKMVEITITLTVSDIGDPTPTIVLTSVESSEPDDAKGNGDGKTVNDIQGADIGSEDYEILLRAERDGNGDGRVYTITYTVTDASGNSATASTIVIVPHDKSDEPDGQNNDLDDGEVDND